jgi:hypothetical protein
MADVFTKAKRSEVMSRIRGRGNKETESKNFRQTGFRLSQGAGGRVRGRLFLARLPETLQHPGQPSGLLETETRRESVAGPPGESKAAQKRVVRRPDLGTRPRQTGEGLPSQNPGRFGRRRADRMSLWTP